MTVKRRLTPKIRSSVATAAEREVLDAVRKPGAGCAEDQFYSVFSHVIAARDWRVTQCTLEDVRAPLMTRLRDASLAKDTPENRGRVAALTEVLHMLDAAIHPPTDIDIALLPLLGDVRQ